MSKKGQAEPECLVGEHEIGHFFLGILDSKHKLSDNDDENNEKKTF